MFEYGFTTKEAVIPGMINFRQELLMILAPKEKYQPHIDPDENSRALGNQKTETINWSQDSYNN